MEALEVDGVQLEDGGVQASAGATVLKLLVYIDVFSDFSFWYQMRENAPTYAETFLGPYFADAVLFFAVAGLMLELVQLYETYSKYIWNRFGFETSDVNEGAGHDYVGARILLEDFPQLILLAMFKQAALLCGDSKFRMSFSNGQAYYPYFITWALRDAEEHGSLCHGKVISANWTPAAEFSAAISVLNIVVALLSKLSKNVRIRYRLSKAPTEAHSVDIQDLKSYQPFYSFQTQVEISASAILVLFFFLGFVPWGARQLFFLKGLLIFFSIPFGLGLLWHLIVPPSSFTFTTHSERTAPFQMESLVSQFEKWTWISEVHADYAGLSKRYQIVEKDREARWSQGCCSLLFYSLALVCTALFVMANMFAIVSDFQSDNAGRPIPGWLHFIVWFPFCFCIWALVVIFVFMLCLFVVALCLYPVLLLLSYCWAFRLQTLNLEVYYVCALVVSPVVALVLFQKAMYEPVECGVSAGLSCNAKARAAW